MRDPASCAVNNSVVAAPLPPDGLPTLLPLARSAVAAGFPCVVVQPYTLQPTAYEAATVAFDSSVLPLPPPVPSLLPRGRWCTNKSKSKGEYEKRRMQFHRMRLWRTLLDRGLDVIGVDPSIRLLRNPLPAIAAIRTRADAQYGSGRKPDVLGGTPGWFLKEYYLHTMWLRSTPATRALLTQAEARARGVYDQTAFSEELNWGAGRGAACCHTACLASHFTTKPVVKEKAHAAQPTVAAAAALSFAASCAADDHPPLAPAPPNETRHVWKDGWRPESYNDLKIPYHRFGRCTGRDVSCEPSSQRADLGCPPAPPPFTRESALADRKKAARAAKARQHKRREK